MYISIQQYCPLHVSTSPTILVKTRNDSNKLSVYCFNIILNFMKFMHYIHGKRKVSAGPEMFESDPGKLQQLKVMRCFFFFFFFFFSSLCETFDTSPYCSLNYRLPAKKKHVAEPFPLNIFVGYKNSAKYYTLSSFTRHLFWMSCRTVAFFLLFIVYVCFQAALPRLICVFMKLCELTLLT